jgi:malate synthase
MGGLQIAPILHDFVAETAVPGTGIDPDAFWAAFEAILGDLGPRNAALLEQRVALHAQIDDWHRARKGQPQDVAVYKAFLEDIGYLLPEGSSCRSTMRAMR